MICCIVHIFVAAYLNIYVPFSLCDFKTKLERQNKMEYQITKLGRAALPIVILDIIILYDSLIDRLQNYKKWSKCISLTVDSSRQRYSSQNGVAVYIAFRIFLLLSQIFYAMLWNLQG